MRNQTCPPGHPRQGSARLVPIGIACLLVLAIVWGWKRGKGVEPEKEVTLVERYLEDQRIARLTADCGIGRPFERDPNHLTDVMVGKLAQGQLDVLHRYKALLAKEGAKAMPALKRLFDKSLAERFGIPVMQNILGTCALMESGAGLELARSAMNHNRDDVRLEALDVITQFGEPSDYDTIAGWIPMVINTPYVLDYLRAMAHCDLDRYANEVLGWMESDTYKSAWFHMAPELIHVTDPEMARRMRDIAMHPETPGPAVAHLLVPACRLGDEVAIGALTKRLTSDLDQRVTLALAAAQEAGVHYLAQVVLTLDERPALRTRAARVLSNGEPTEESFAWLNEGLSDSDANVRLACLEGLLIRKDEAAARRVLLDLTKSSHEREGIFAVLASRWDASPNLPQTVLDVLKKEFAASTTQEQKIDIMKVVGRIPLREAAQFVLDHYGELPEKLGGIRSHRWAAGHAFNAGPGGVDELRHRLTTETDPFRRMDLIGMIWQDKSQESADCLMGVLTDPSLDEFERLFAADRLTLIEHPEVVAPVVKQFYFESTHRYVRPALQCLLWRWYGLPKS